MTDIIDQMPTPEQIRRYMEIVGLELDDWQRHILERIAAGGQVDVSGFDGKHSALPGGWRWIVVDMHRLPSQQVVLVGVRASQPEALEAACAQIKRCSGGGQ